MSDDNRWTVTPWTLIALTVLAAALHLLTWRVGPIAVARDIRRLEQRVEAIEQEVGR